MKHYTIPLLLTLILFSCQNKEESLYQNNRTPLTKNAFIELPIGSIQAEGWLKERLISKKNGLTGNLNELYPLVWVIQMGG